MGPMQIRDVGDKEGDAWGYQWAAPWGNAVKLFLECRMGLGCSKASLLRFLFALVFVLYANGVKQHSLGLRSSPPQAMMPQPQGLETPRAIRPAPRNLAAKPPNSGVQDGRREITQGGGLLALARNPYPGLCCLTPLA